MADVVGGIAGGDGPDLSKAKRRQRRSWFNDSTSVTFEIAVEQPQKKPIRHTIKEEIETLQLNHFAVQPKIDFGSVRVGQSSTRVLRLNNPCGFEQHVVVERFPADKNFVVDVQDVTVGAHDEHCLTLIWSPKEGGNCRELVLFHVDNVYRLQAVMFGCALANSKAKKRNTVTI